jgi:hypothetical protein
LSALATALPREVVNARLGQMLVTAAIGFAVFLTGFVIREPAPYELFMAALMPIWAMFGLRLSRTVAPMALFIALFVIGGLISMAQLKELEDIPMYLTVTLFLGLTGVFFAAVLESRPDLYGTIFRAWALAGAATTVLGIAGYFGLTPGGLFTLYGRAAGAFKDPNVFGPFLVPPILYLFHRMLVGHRLSTVDLGLLLLLSAGVFFSFSRGAWGLLGFCVVAIAFLQALQSSSNLFRLRVMLAFGLAVAGLTVVLIVLLQIPAVAEMFVGRAQLVQDYDGARLGRFARFIIGYEMAMEHPLGIGPLAFGKMLGEDTHHIWLKALLDYSWLGFIAYFSLVALTIGGGFRILFRDRPWQPFLLVAYVAFVGHVLLGSVIDTNHWRHFWLLLGMVWAAMALEARHQRNVNSRGAVAQVTSSAH